MTTRSRLLAITASTLLAVSCVSQQQELEAKKPTATQTALQRGRFDLDCPAATATMLSSDFIQPAIQGPFVSGLERVEYTVGVAGCGKRATYVVICQVDGDTCFAAHPDSHFQR